MLKHVVRSGEATWSDDRFERVGSDAHISGLGLGLYIVKEIVKAHSGDIQLTSAPGQGAEFVVQLPL